MKNFNVNTKPSSLFGKGITVLFLLVVLQARNCGGTAGHKVTQMDLETFHQDIENQKDISIRDEKGRNQLYACVKKNEVEKAKIVLNRYIEDIESRVKHANRDFVNERDPISGNTPTEQAIIQAEPAMVNLLISPKYHNIININTIHPVSGNTLIHFAIKTKKADIIQKVLDHFEKQEQGLLYAQNNNGDTPLHFAAEYKLKDIQAKLIALLPPDKFWIKNNKGQASVDIGMENNQVNLIKLLYQAPLEKLIEKNKNNQTRLHIAAHLHLQNAFKIILERIKKLDKDKAVSQLFEKTKESKSVWMCIILSRMSIQPMFSHKDNVKMFTDAIRLVKDSLQEKHWNDISNDITHLENKGCIRGGISKDYANELRTIVKNAKNNRN